MDDPRTDLEEAGGCGAGAESSHVANRLIGPSEGLRDSDDSDRELDINPAHSPISVPRRASHSEAPRIPLHPRTTKSQGPGKSASRPYLPEAPS
jgi:hypothetical protein